MISSNPTVMKILKLIQQNHFGSIKIQILILFLKLLRRQQLSRPLFYLKTYKISFEYFLVH
jgi:hypothetical protein